jgi:hypothetical protein
MPLLMIASGAFAYIKIRQLRKRNKIGCFFSSYLLGTIIATLLPPCLILMLLIGFAIPGGELASAMSEKTYPVWDFNLFDSLIQWGVSIAHVWLVAWGPGGLLGIATLLVHRLVRGAQVRRDGLAAEALFSNTRRTRIEVALVIAMSLVGWTALFVWPIDFSLKPSP